MTRVCFGLRPETHWFWVHSLVPDFEPLPFFLEYSACPSIHFIIGRFVTGGFCDCLQLARRNEGLEIPCGVAASLRVSPGVWHPPQSLVGFLTAFLWIPGVAMAWNQCGCHRQPIRGLGEGYGPLEAMGKVPWIRFCLGRWWTYRDQQPCGADVLALSCALRRWRRLPGAGGGHIWTVRCGAIEAEKQQLLWAFWDCLWTAKTVATVQIFTKTGWRSDGRGASGQLGLAGGCRFRHRCGTWELPGGAEVAGPAGFPAALRGEWHGLCLGACRARQQWWAVDQSTRRSHWHHHLAVPKHAAVDGCCKHFHTSGCLVGSVQCFCMFVFFKTGWRFQIYNFSIHSPSLSMIFQGLAH